MVGSVLSGWISSSGLRLSLGYDGEWLDQFLWPTLGLRLRCGVVGSVLVVYVYAQATMGSGWISSSGLRLGSGQEGEWLYWFFLLRLRLGGGGVG